ncbi:MAG: histidine kinase [Vicinamibacterales bacterium]|nr:histidine kinase [Vicinamibacterales bacterium]
MLTLPVHVAALANLAGFVAGAALYGVLLAMTLRERRSLVTTSSSADRTVGLLPIVTGVVGLVWNLGALAVHAGTDFGLGSPHPAFTALAFCGLGVLPAVVVHSVLRAGTGPAADRGHAGLVVSAYAVSAVSAILHVIDAAHGVAPSALALRVATVGYLLLLVPLVLATRSRGEWRRTVWVVSLAVFAVSALHLAEHEGFASPWYVELVAHHSSLPLALVILYEDYRFALGDLFLKRALALSALVALAFAAFALVIAPVAVAPSFQLNDPRSAGAIVAAIVAVALLYQGARRAAAWFVDRVVLRRAAADQVMTAIAAIAESHSSVEDVLDEACVALAPALSAREVLWWSEHAHGPGECGRLEVPADSPLGQAAARAATAWRNRPGHGLVTLGERAASAVTVVPLAEPPRFALVVSGLTGGRRLLSDDVHVLERAAGLLARRGDALRLQLERFDRQLHQEQAGRLATEAELRALRSQLNPHFLFNALTTVGFLIEQAPARALDTLLRLTELLRRVLAADFDVTTLGAELEFVEAYLDIERARFEDRLSVEIQAPPGLRSLTVPPFAVQTLVENAIKHGIAPTRAGGRVVVAAREVEEPEGPVLVILVRDTGAGSTPEDIEQGRRHGVGLANLERRVKLAHGPRASLTVRTARDRGTEVELRLPRGGQDLISGGPPSRQHHGHTTQSAHR